MIETRACSKDSTDTQVGETSDRSEVTGVIAPAASRTIARVDTPVVRCDHIRLEASGEACSGKLDVRFVGGEMADQQGRRRSSLGTAVSKEQFASDMGPGRGEVVDGHRAAVIFNDKSIHAHIGPKVPSSNRDRPWRGMVPGPPSVT